ncbi:hypothetical protein C8R44DRAFT_751520 [Mycena epipterygia]|nr:hypothetical protein C8R44DRAFT_751520 [Mycena epipterygia]
MADIPHLPTSSAIRRKTSAAYVRKACANCRRRKIGCDGSKPVCTSCRLHAATVEAEEMARIQDSMKEPDTSDSLETSKVFLSDPYATRHVSSMNYPLVRASLPPTTTQEFCLVHNAMEVFLKRFSHCGLFFLERHRFRHSALLSLPFGHPARPAPGLLSAVYLWSSHISANAPAFLYTEQQFLALTVHNLAHDLSGVHPHLILHTIQTEVLLSYYYLDRGHILEGRQHCAAALSLASCAGIHQIGSIRHPPIPPFALSTAALDTPSEEIEEQERSNAFWSLVVLNNFWAAASGLPPIRPYNILTDSAFTREHGIATIAQFLGGVDRDGHSPFALLAKASILLERIIAFWENTPGAADVTEFGLLASRLDKFQQSLPRITSNDTAAAEPALHSLLLTHCITNVAILRLHAPQSGSFKEESAFMAAARFTDDLNEAHVLKWRYSDPIMGPLILTVCKFYILQLPYIREAASKLQELIFTTSKLAELSPIISKELSHQRSR